MVRTRLLIAGQALGQATYLWGILKILRILLGLRACWQAETASLGCWLRVSSLWKSFGLSNGGVHFGTIAMLALRIQSRPVIQLSFGGIMNRKQAIRGTLLFVLFSVATMAAIDHWSDA